MLTDRDLEGLDRWAAESRNAPEILLASLLYETDELLRWRGIEALGRMARSGAGGGLAGLRNIIRRMLWSMNDESGGVGWFAPEAIGEILFNVPELFSEYGVILASFLREEPFERGTHWAMARIGRKDAALAAHVEATLIESLEDSDPSIRGHAALALEKMGSQKNRQRRDALAADDATFPTYDFSTGWIKMIIVGDCVHAQAVE